MYPNFIGEEISEIIDTWRDGEYLGPWTNLDTAGSPINFVDRLAQTHDWAYERADRTGGHMGRVEKAKADFAMAYASDNYVLAAGMYTQGIIRVFTFNAFNLPW